MSRYRENFTKIFDDLVCLGIEKTLLKSYRIVNKASYSMEMCRTIIKFLVLTSSSWWGCYIEGLEK